MDSKELLSPHLKVLKILGFQLNFNSEFEKIKAYCTTGLVTLSFIVVCPCLLHFVLNNFDDIPRVSIPIGVFVTLFYMLGKLSTLHYYRSSIERLVNDLRKISMEGNFGNVYGHKKNHSRTPFSEFR